MTVTEALEQVALFRVEVARAKIRHAKMMFEYNECLEHISAIECLINAHETVGVDIKVRGNLGWDNFQPSHLKTFQGDLPALEQKVVEAQKALSTFTSRLSIAEVVLKTLMSANA